MITLHEGGKPAPLVELDPFVATDIEVRERWRIEVAAQGQRLQVALGLRDLPLRVVNGGGGLGLHTVGIAGTVRIGRHEFDIAPEHVTDPTSEWRRSLLTMMERAARRRVDYTVSERLRLVQGTFVDFFAFTFAVSLEHASRHEQVRLYRSQREAAPVLRGRLLVSEQLRSSLTRPHLLVCEVDRLDADNPVNQLLCWAGNQLLPAVQDGRVRRTLSHQLDILPSVSATRPPLPFRTRLPQQFAHYATAVDLALALARALGPEAQRDSNPGGGLVVGTERLFEQFVEQSLAVISPGRPWTVDAQHRKRFAVTVPPNDGRDYFSQPDNIVRAGGQGTLIVDAKYKRFEDASEDVGGDGPTIPTSIRCGRSGGSWLPASIAALPEARSRCRAPHTMVGYSRVAGASDHGRSRHRRPQPAGRSRRHPSVRRFAGRSDRRGTPLTAQERIQLAVGVGAAAVQGRVPASEETVFGWLGVAASLFDGELPSWFLERTDPAVVYLARAAVIEVLGAIPPPELAHAFEGHLAASDSGTHEGRRRSGAYYTPATLVDLVVEQTIGPIAARATSTEELLAIRIFDPAVGCGGFLLAALRLLVAHAVELSRGALSTAQASRLIVERSLYGVDVNPLAALVTAGLLRRTTNAKRAPHPNIQWADTLLVHDVGFRSAAGVPPIDVAAWPDGAGPFDAVIGNPPWGPVKPAIRQFLAHADPSALTRQGAELWDSVRSSSPGVVQRWDDHAKKTREYAAALRASSAYRHQGPGDADLYRYFVERAHGLIGEEGRLGLLVPGGILRAEGTAPLRQLLLRTGTIELALEFINTSRLFAIHPMFRFAMLVWQTRGTTRAAPGWIRSA